MNGTRYARTSLCGIVLDNGRDCPAAVMPDAPINLCPEHFAVAAEWVNLNTDAARDRVVCELCGELAAYPGATGYLCHHCGFESVDHSGPRRLTYAEKAALGEHDSPRYKTISVVYYLKFADRIKIGTSTDFRKRREAIPHDDVLALERGGPDVERRRHSQFASHRLTGEWFKPAPELLAHIVGLRHPQGWEKQLREWEGKPW